MPLVFQYGSEWMVYVDKYSEEWRGTGQSEGWRGEGGMKGASPPLGTLI